MLIFSGICWIISWWSIMNTSFNLEFEPIVCAPEDAIRTFYSSGADYLAMGDVLISKNS